MTVARRRPPQVTHGAAGSLILPAGLTFQRMGDWSSTVEFHAARREWLREHGIDPADWRTLALVFEASRRQHARRVRDFDALSRARRIAEGAGPDDAA